MVIPKCGGVPYQDSEMIFIINTLQATAYIANGAHLYDCLVGYDGKLMYVFKRSETWKLYKKWCAHELPIPGREDA